MAFARRPFGETGDFDSLDADAYFCVVSVCRDFSGVALRGWTLGFVRRPFVETLICWFPHAVAGICLATTPEGFPRVTLLMRSLTSMQRPFVGMLGFLFSPCGRSLARSVRMERHSIINALHTDTGGRAKSNDHRPPAKFS